MANLNIDPVAHQATMICTAVLFFKFLITTLIQGKQRFSAGSRPPEDSSLSLAKNVKAKQTFGMSLSDNEKHAEADIRWQRIVHNDIENVFMGLIVSWASLLSAFSPSVHAGAVVVFTIGRIMHTISYAKSLQPHRAIGWLVAVLAIIVMVLNGTMGVIV